MFNDDFVERLRYEIDPHWQGEIPLTLLIAPNGAITTIEGVANLAKVTTWLDAQGPHRDSHRSRLENLRSVPISRPASPGSGTPRGQR